LPFIPFFEDPFGNSKTWRLLGPGSNLRDVFQLLRLGEPMSTDFFAFTFPAFFFENPIFLNVSFKSYSQARYAPPFRSRLRFF